MRTTLRFNDNWLYDPVKRSFAEGDASFEPVTLPHTNKTYDHRTVLENEYQFESTYRKRFKLPVELDGQKAFLKFDGAMQLARVYLNQELVGQHAGGFTPFMMEITSQLQPGENLLQVDIDSHELPTFPPNGYRLDYLPFGGLYRDVTLLITNPVHITDVFVRPQDVLTKPGLDVDYELSQAGDGLSISAELLNSDGNVVASESAPAGQKGTISFKAGLQVELWSLENPVFYTLRTRVSRSGEILDETATRFGFRAAEFAKDGKFYLNGKPIKLVGLNRHQTYPFIGMAAPDRLQRMDAEILKHELGLNIVRSSHYPQAPAFLDRCDEIGLLVLEEIPGWQYIGDASWQEFLLEHEREMILRDRNHPSIILWGVRINESPDNDELYKRTNALAHELDSTRQTGGIRNFISSNFLEDVYTFNDFPHGLTEPSHIPHLITEYGGHMFPTKTWDNEDRLVEHALIHVRKQDLQFGRPEISGAIGWCAFDYNTHPEYGSGDRICHHGVMDIFRLPKWAAAFYRSQKDPSVEVVLKAATYWTRGDRSVGGTNPLTVFSNCEEIEVFVDGQSIGRHKPNKADYPHLIHPPFTVKWPLPYNPWADPYGDLKIIGSIGGKVVAQHEMDAAQRPHKLSLHADSRELVADGADMTRVVVSIDDKYGNPLPYQVRVVSFEASGVELIGENPMALVGGQSACLVKSRHKAGTATITAKCAGFEDARIQIEVKSSSN